MIKYRRFNIYILEMVFNSTGVIAVDLPESSHKYAYAHLISGCVHTLVSIYSHPRFHQIRFHSILIYINRSLVCKREVPEIIRDETPS